MESNKWMVGNLLCCSRGTETQNEKDGGPVRSAVRVSSGGTRARAQISRTRCAVASPLRSDSGVLEGRRRGAPANERDSAPAGQGAAEEKPPFQGRNPHLPAARREGRSQRHAALCR